MRPDASPALADEAGFTLLEVLAAVAIAGFMLSAIGGLVAVTFAGVRSATDRVALARVGQSLLASLPTGGALRPGTTTGASGTTRWRIEVTPARGLLPPPSAKADDAPAMSWALAAVTITARDRSGRSLRLDTVSLLHRPDPS